MNRSTWQRAKEIFDEARGLNPEERAPFIDKECGNLDELRTQVAQLLAAYESDFLEDTALGAAEVLVTPVLADGLLIGRYNVREMIGSGGMGQVFRAEDTQLSRPVAFKVLHNDVAEDAERVRRFIQEAKAASALNHPNILTIHEIGTFEGARYIVSEYVDGETLRERMRRGLNVSESIEIICQIAAALQAAHAAGIVHRDIKPENIMIRRDGLVKVLDFGLAKLTELDDQPIDPNAPLSHIQTSPGLVMGTAAYMSPEQARGQAVDARTDLWSLGVVFHEMLTGKSPFEGESATELITSILSTEGTPADVDSLPPELTPICKKALTKEKEKRYQSAHDLLEDLKGEKKRMEYAIQSPAFVSAVNTDELRTQLIRPRPTLSAEYIVTTVKRHKYATLVTIVVVLFAGVGLSVYQYNGASPPPDENSVSSAIGASTTEADLRISRFTSSGKIAHVSISPDGKYIAYITADGPEKRALRLRARDGSKDSEIVPSPAKGNFSDLSFSPDSAYVYYRHSFPPGTQDTVNRVSIAGGTPTNIIVNSYSGGSVSPDGKMLAFGRDYDCKYDQGCGDDVIVAGSDGKNERILARSSFEGPAWVVCGQIPAWSPDGKTLACATSFDSDQGRYDRITYINVADGSKRMRDETWQDLSGAVYLPDGSLIVAGKLQSSERLAPSQLWLITENSPPKSITSDATGYSTLSATRSGDVLMTIQSRTLLDFWSVQNNDPSTMKQITNSGELVAGGGFNWTPDGKVLFISSVTGNSEVWIMNGDGSGRKQLTNAPGYKLRPKMSSDGRYIVFMGSNNGWDAHVFRINADGSNLKQLTFGWSERDPHISLDGKWVYFISFPDKEGENRLCKVSIEGGEPIQLAVGARIVLDVSSADGRILYADQPGGQLKSVKIMSPSDPRDVKTVAKPAQTIDGGVKWSFDGKYLIFADRKNPAFHALQTVTLNGEMLPKPLITFPRGIGDFRWTKDGKQLGFISGTSTSEGVMISKKAN